jgi:NAD+ diphosphatase
MSTPAFTFCPRCATALTRTEESGTPRTGCPAEGCDNPTPVVAAIVERGDSVLLVRSHGWPESWFGLVTGFLERGESPTEGILREIEEELGITDAHIVSLVGNYSFTAMNQVILAYHVRVTGEVTLGDELAAYKAVPTAKLRPWPMGTGEAVRDWLAAREG